MNRRTRALILTVAAMSLALAASLAAGAAEPRVVLTPKPGPEPRINGARVFGVRPGSPFLFTIPATGERPMTFAVENLPEGLTLDAATGRITGALAAPGAYPVTFTATNRLGTDSRPFRIVCGDTLALTPHMGWNSWYVWENRVTDEIMRRAADAMVSTGMIDHGYQYVNIDDCWSIRQDATDPSLLGEPRDARGMINANGRFPDMKAMTDYIHSKGLKAGIYTSPGPTTCAGYVAAWQHEELDVQRFVEWGFDFLKYDWCSYGRIATDEKDRAELQKPYRLISSILAKQPRDIVLNICQYGMGNVWEWGREVGGNSWRTAGDLGHDVVVSLFRDGFDVYSANELHRYGGPGGWNDPDYLLIGILSSVFVDDKEGGTRPRPSRRTSNTPTSRSGRSSRRRSSSAATSPASTTSPSACSRTTTSSTSTRTRSASPAAASRRPAISRSGCASSRTARRRSGSSTAARAWPRSPPSGPTSASPARKRSGTSGAGKTSASSTAPSARTSPATASSWSA